jgi:translation initiation factor IF-1
MHARFYQQLVKDQQVVKEARQAGYDIRDLDSKSRIARLTGLDRRAKTRYLDSDVQVGIAPEEKGRVRVQFRLKDLQRSAEVSRGKKRGRKTKSS